MGHLLIFEGLDGSGKSSQISLLKEYLIENGEKVITTREPGGTEFGENCRELFLKNKLDGNTETFLALASRNYHIINKIKPALKKGYWVLCDRFSDSTIAYQGWGRGVSVELIRQLSNQIELEVKILKIIFFETNYQDNLKRLAKRQLINDKFEMESMQFFERVTEGFKSAAIHRGNLGISIDGSLSMSKVFKKIIEMIPELKTLKSKRDGIN